MARHAAKKKRKTWRQYMPLILAAALLLTAIFAVARLAGEQSGGEGSDGNDGTTVTSVTTTGETTTTMAEITTTTTTDRAIGVVTTMAPITTTTTTTTTTTNTTTTTTARPVTGHYVQKSVPSWELRLVNPWNPLPEDFNYTANLADYTTGKQFDSRAMTQLRQMIAAGSDYACPPRRFFVPRNCRLRCITVRSANG